MDDRDAKERGLLRFRLNKPPLILACGIGVVLGLGSYTFDYGEGLSYFSTDPVACANCHIMNEQYDSWTKAGHHQAAVCVDCHLPHAFVPKYIAKADNGYRHSKGFTFMDFHEPIMIKPRNAEILQENCLRCHGDFVHDIVPGSISEHAASEGISCVHCHRGVGHGARNGGGGAGGGSSSGGAGVASSESSRAAELARWVKGDQP